MTLEEDILGVEMNGNGSLLAISVKNNILRIVNVPSMQIVYNKDIKNPIIKMHWAGTNSDILVLHQKDDLFALMADRQSGKFTQNPSKIPLFSDKKNNQALVRDFACDADHVLVFATNQFQGLVVWSLEKNKMVQMASQIDKRNETRLGWRDKDTYCVYQGRNVVETSILPENTQNSLMPRSIDQWDLPSAAQDVIWLDGKKLVFLSDQGVKNPQIYYLKRGSQTSIAEFDSSGQIVYKLQALNNTGQFAAYCLSGKVLIYQPAIQ